MYDGNKNKYIKLIIFVCLITVFFIIYFLFKNDNLEIKMANETEYVELGQEKEIKVFLNGKESNDINLLSENIDVLDVVENNVVKGKKIGETILSANYNKKNINTSCKVVVYTGNLGVDLENVNIKEENIILKDNEKFNINDIIEVVPNNSFIFKKEYFSSNNDVLNINDKGIIIPNGIGETKISVNINNSFFKEINVNIINTDLVNIKFKDELPIKMQIGEKRQLKFEEDITIGKHEIIWSSENNDIVSVDHEGNIEALSEGTVNIIAKINNVEKKAEIIVEANGILASEKVLDSIKKTNCLLTYTDNLDTSDPSDDIIYFSGNNNCVNNNYVWYSGKLWRIISINSNKEIELITDDLITTITWGKNDEYNGSWVYQWLNEDFFDKLYNSDEIIKFDAVWNYSAETKKIPTRPNVNGKIVKAPVGLLNSYEYSMTQKNASLIDNYLYNGFYWWLLTPYIDGGIRSVDHNGKEDLNIRIAGRYGRGIRPVIYLNSKVRFNGDGTKNNPYTIVGDIKEPLNGELLNNRISGEFVKFNNDLYRIVDIIDNKAKIIRLDYLRDSSNEIINEHIAGTIYFGNPTNSKNAKYWDNYLNTTWYNTIPNEYQKMIANGTFYLGSYSLNMNYKHTICDDSMLDNISIKNCHKLTGKNTFIGKIGLVRMGEMFAAQQQIIKGKILTFWTITPHDNRENRIILETNAMYRHLTVGGFHAARPTFYLSENVKISSGNGRYENPLIIYE